MPQVSNRDRSKSVEVHTNSKPVVNNEKGNPRYLLWGVIIIVIGLLLLCTKSSLIGYITSCFFILAPNSMLKKLWITSPAPILVDVYIFNWTNPDDFYDTLVKPKLQEVGPYRFMQNVEKVNLTWNQNSTVTFRYLRTFHFDAKATNGSVSDLITTVNLITASVSGLIKDFNIIVKKGVSIVIDSVSPNAYVTKTAEELLYNGIDDFFIDAGKALPFLYPSIPRFEKFALIALRNASIDFDGIFNMATGVNGDFSLKRWNYYSEIPYFKNPCRKVRGTLGELNGLKLSREYVTIFLPELCRYLTLVYAEDILVNGLLGYKYIVGRQTLDNGSTNAENRCFCDKGCIPSGLLSMVSCRYNIPGFLSLPHFYLADTSYLDAVDGLKPEELKHESYIILEPTTGVPLLVSIGIQVNLLVRPVQGIDVYEGARKIYFPLGWIKQSTSIPDSWAIALKVYLAFPDLLTGVSISIMMLGLCLILIWKKYTISAIINRKFWSKKTSKHTNKNEYAYELTNAEHVYFLKDSPNMSKF